MNGLVSLGGIGVGEEGDLRGRPVFAGDGTLLGEVADVLGTQAGEARYLAVALEASVARTRGGREVVVPIAGARIDGARRLHLDGVTGANVTTLPSTPGAAFVDPDATVLDYARVADSPAAAPVAAQPAAAPIAAAPLASQPAAAPLAAQPTNADEARVTLSEEQLAVGTRTVSAGEVRVTKHVETVPVRESVAVMREEVTVERRPLAAGASLEPRTEGNITYVPIIEEEIVITKRLVAREELVITKHQVTENRVVEDTVRREVAEVRGAGDGPV